MDGREFGKALERALVNWRERLSVQHPQFRTAADLCLIVHDALNAGPQNVSNAPAGAPLEGSAGGLTDEAYINVLFPKADLARLRARDQWINDHAVPALEWYARFISESRYAPEALAALPPEPTGEGKP